MCNLYTMRRNVDAIRRLFRIGDNRAMRTEPRDAIFPGHGAPVVRQDQDGGGELADLSCGSALPQKAQPRMHSRFAGRKRVRARG